MADPRAPPPSVVDLHAQLRSKLALDALPLGPSDTEQAFAAALDAIAGPSKNLTAIAHLISFFYSVVSTNIDLSTMLPNLSHEILINLNDINSEITHAWATVLCLDGPQLSTDTVLLAVSNLFSAATPRVQETQKPQEATSRNTLLNTPKIPVTPSKRPAIVEDDTPVHANSALPYSALAHTRAHVDPFLRAELRGTILKNVKGFYKFFPGITEQQWTCAVNCPASCDCISPQSSNLPHSSDPPFTIPNFPTEITERSVLQWFECFNKQDHSRTFYTSCKRPLAESLSASNRQCDLFLAPTCTKFGTSEAAPAAAHTWPSVLVPVELKASPAKDAAADTTVQLASYVREVFGAQYTRRFVHAFTICGSLVRYHLFDRAGGSISEKINIRKNRRTEELFIRILQAYLSMDPTQLGFDENYEYVWANNTTSSIPSPEAPMPQFFKFGGRRFQLLKNVFHRSVIVSRGTTVWEAVDLGSGEACVIKDSWRASWRTAEGHLLALAHNKGVFALSTPIVYGDVVVQLGEQAVVDTIDHIRMGLCYDDARRMVIKFKPEDDLYSLGTSLPVIQVSIGPSQKWSFRATEKSMMREGTRKRSLQATIAEENASEVRQSKVRRVENIESTRSRGSRGKSVVAYRRTGRSQAHLTATTTKTLQSISRQKANRSNDTPSNTATTSAPPKQKGSCSSVKDLMVVTGNPELDWTLNAPSGVTETSPTPRESADHSSVVDPEMVFMDMTHSVIVSHGVGEDIQNFTSVRDLIKGMRDAIKCHKSLFESAGILHRDVSPGNIMLSKYRSRNIESGSGIVSSEAPHGFLIDLDLAKYVGPIQATADSTSKSMRRRTGTMLFMAIEILQGTCLRHSWRHDLESFFYVFIWLCVTRHDGYLEARITFEKQWAGGNAVLVKKLQATQQIEYEEMMEWIPESLKGGAVERVVWSWREILFPTDVKSRRTMMGEEGRDREAVYNDMLLVLEKELQ
ncbi:hypothetical protein BGX38DRAFT_1277603 [Terfezia claveryi]|nr:hypothetical protein BGX38DRAFT_1277603 [Terfezia claveryi]